MLYYPALVLLILVPILHPNVAGESKMSVVYKKTAQTVSVEPPETPPAAAQYTSPSGVDPTQTRPTGSPAQISVAPTVANSPPLAPAADVAVAPTIPDNKYDGDCATVPTVGRCADKCPNQTDILEGRDPTTGATICTPAHPNGDPNTQQGTFACGSADKQLTLYEMEFRDKPELKQTDEWTRYQQLQVAYQQNCE